MNSENTLPGKIESLLATVFILALFYGDVHFGVVFPLSMAVLPVLLAVAIARRRAISGVFTLGLALLLGVLFALVLQKFAGTAPPARADWGLYGPLIYAIATAFTFSLVRVSDTTLWRSLALGGVLAAVAVLATIALVPAGQFPIPGQNYTETEHEYKQTKSPGRDVTKFNATVATEIGKTEDKTIVPFYDVKNNIRSPFGRSNYLAVFSVFLFSVALFRRNRAMSILFAVLTLATLSRLGMVFLALVFLIWLAHSARIRHPKIITVLALGVLALGVLSAAVALAWPELLAKLPGRQSVAARLLFWQSGLQPVMDHPFLGSPRSAILDKYGYLLTWNPHNSLLWITALFGVWGLACYVAYISAALRSFYRRATGSPMWLGILAGICVALAWSMLEIIVLTPGFEILLALLYGLSTHSGAASRDRGNIGRA
jgi:hypothetical protein